MTSGLMPCASKRADHADMGKAARAAAAERKPDGRPLRCARRRIGRRFGAAVTVSSVALDFEHHAFLNPSRRDDHAARLRCKAVPQSRW